MQSTEQAPATANPTPSGNPAPAALTLRPTIDANGFTFPSLYSFPPFFTRQPNPATWNHQLAQWQQLVLAYARYNKLWQVDISQLSSAAPPFANPQIKRA